MGKSGTEDGLVLEVTPEMKKAGRYELFDSFVLGGDYEDLATQIFLAMAFESPQLLPLLIPSR